MSSPRGCKRLSEMLCHRVICEFLTDRRVGLQLPDPVGLVVIGGAQPTLTIASMARFSSFSA